MVAQVPESGPTGTRAVQLAALFPRVEWVKRHFLLPADLPWSIILTQRWLASARTGG